MMRAALMAACLVRVSAPFGWAADAAAVSSTKAVHIAAFRRTHYSLELPLVDPFEHLLREGVASLVKVENHLVQYDGDRYMIRASADSDSFKGGESEIPILETEGGFFALIPYDGDLMRRFEALIDRPENYLQGRVPRVRKTRASLSRRQAPDCGTLHTFRIRSNSAWASVRAFHRLRWATVRSWVARVLTI